MKHPARVFLFLARGTAYAGFIAPLVVFLSGCGNDSLFHRLSGGGSSPQYVNQSQPVVFLLMGQSNMVGAGDLPGPEPNPQIQNFCLDGVLRTAQESLQSLYHGVSGSLFVSSIFHREDEKYGVGPGLFFAKEYLKRHPNQRIILLPCSRGATPMSDFQPGGQIFAETVNRWNALKRQVPNAYLGAILFWQGEADAHDQTAIDAWPSQLLNLTLALRSLTSSQAPLGFVQIKDIGTDAAIRAAQDKAQYTVPNSKMVNCEGLPFVGVHATTQAQAVIGGLLYHALFGN